MHQQQASSSIAQAQYQGAPFTVEGANLHSAWGIKTGIDIPRLPGNVRFSEYGFPVVTKCVALAKGCALFYFSVGSSEGTKQLRPTPTTQTTSVIAKRWRAKGQEKRKDETICQ